MDSLAFLVMVVFGLPGFAVQVRQLRACGVAHRARSAGTCGPPARDHRDSMPTRTPAFARSRAVIVSRASVRHRSSVLRRVAVEHPLRRAWSGCK